MICRPGHGEIDAAHSRVQLTAKGTFLHMQLDTSIGDLAL